MTHHPLKAQKLFGSASEPLHTFTIHYNHTTIDLSLPSKSTVGELTDLVKSKVQPFLRDRFVCL